MSDALAPSANRPVSRPSAGRMIPSETKPAFKTTELMAYIAAVVGVLVASFLVGQRQGGDAFPADQAWWYVTLLTIGYMVSRGLSKAGSHSPKRID